MKQIALTYEERYQLGYLQGYRIGRIGETRRILINCLNGKCKEQNFLLGKKIIQKINRETDLDFLGGIILSIINDLIPITEIENCYDMLFLLPNKNDHKKSFLRWSSADKASIILNKLLEDE